MSEQTEYAGRGRRYGGVQVAWTQSEHLVLCLVDADLDDSSYVELLPDEAAELAEQIQAELAELP